MVVNKPNDVAKRVFLAGPIQGAPAWHEEIINELGGLNVIINSPKRAVKEDFNYDLQVEWETYHLSTDDIIVFYLAAEETKIEGRSYAQTSRFELGENLSRIKYTNSNQRVLIFGDKGFVGLSYLKLKAESENYNSFTSYFSDKEEFFTTLKKLIKED